jgi:hypothetical protein
VYSRILEKQNRLQMSQVLFHCVRINHQVVLLFKDSSEAAEPRRCHAERGPTYPLHLVGLKRGLASFWLFFSVWIGYLTSSACEHLVDTTPKSLPGRSSCTLLSGDGKRGSR